MQVCPHCGEENPERFRHCGFCGTSLGPDLGKHEVRKTVTIVFCDLKGSTSLAERLDSETFRDVLNHYFARMEKVLEGHGGTVEKFIGDAIMAVFGLPRAHEDDAMRAVRAAADMQKALAELNEELDLAWRVTLANRTGINTGEVVAGEVTAGQRLVTGDAVNVAARLEQAAGEFEIIIGEATHRLVRDAVEVEPLEPLSLKGKDQPVMAYRLLSIRSTEALTRRVDTPLIGRTAERELLRERFERAKGDRRCQVVTILGQAGMGKSRLIHEFLQLVAADARSLRGRCLPYGEGITFWPLSEIVHQAAGITSEDGPELALSKLSDLSAEDGPAIAERVGAAIGLASRSFSTEEIFWGTRKLLEAMARDRPLIVVIDDLHWAESTFLDLIEQLRDLVIDAPVLLVCSARPDLLEVRPTWGVEENAARIALEPLSAQDSALVLENVLGEGGLPPQLRARIIHAAEGNPLFMEQMLSMLVEEELLARGSDGQWALAKEPSEFIVPPSIASLLAARLDQLPIDERVALERGAVAGQIFYRGAVTALAPESIRPHLAGALASLTRKQLIQPEDSDIEGEEAFRFRHILIRDVAYHGLLKRGRAQLHEGFADWLEVAVGRRVMEYEEILGYHLEQAHRYRAELGVIDEAVRGVGRRAAGPLASAGRRAFGRGDMPAAANLLQRAAVLLEEDDPKRLDLLPDIAEALMDIGEFAKAQEWLEEATRAGARLGDRCLQMEARIVGLLFGHSTGSQVGPGELLREAAEAIRVMEEAGDHSGLAKAWRFVVLVHGTACRYGEAEVAVRNVIEHARRAGDHRQEMRILPSYALAALYGPTPVQEAIAVSRQVVELASGDRRAEAWALAVRSLLAAMQDRFGEARLLYARSRELFEELGQRLLASQVSLFSGRVEMLAEDFPAAESELRRDFAALTAMGEKYFLANVAPLLALAVYLQGRHEEAEKLSRIGEEAATEDDIEAQALWRRARARVLAHRGRFNDAVRLAREAEALMAQTDGLNMRANTLMDSAEVLRLAGRDDEATPLVQEALRLYEQKGNRVSARGAGAVLESLEENVVRAP